MRFRQGERCNTQNCADGSSGIVHSIIVPDVQFGDDVNPDIIAASAQFSQTGTSLANAAALDEEIGEKQIF
jgi:hypothetical protein